MTGQADVRWIWMAVALVVVAVPLLTVLVSRELRVLQERVVELEHRLAAQGAAVRSEADSRVADRAELRSRLAEVEARASAGAGAGAAAEVERLRRQLEDVLRTLSALRPAEPEFTEEYYLEALPHGDGRP